MDDERHRPNAQTEEQGQGKGNSSRYFPVQLIGCLLKAEQNLERLGITGFKNMLTEYELTIASQLVNPDEIETSWKDIAGLDDIIEELKATVILPIKIPNLYNLSKLHEPPKGVLLHGPPGVGKTMVAKATAKEAGAR